MKFVAATLLLLGFTLPTSAQEEETDVRKELSKQMKVIAGRLRQAGEVSLAIGQIAGPPNFPSSSGPGLALLLAEELEKSERSEKNPIRIKSRATLGLRGQYHLAAVPWDPMFPKKERLAVALKLSVVDIRDMVPYPELKELACNLVGETAVMTLLAPPVTLPNLVPEDLKAKGVQLDELRDLALRKAIADPKAAIRKAEQTIQSEEKSPFAVQILVDGKAIDPQDDEGLAFLKLHPDKPFTIKLINNSKEEAAVRLAIDGIDAFAFSEDRVESGDRRGEPRFTVFVVGAKDSFVVPGWHVLGKRYEPFSLKGYGKETAALSRHNDTPLGMITARFSVAWEGDRDPPKDEPPAKRNVKGVDPNSKGTSPDMTTGAINRSVGVVRSVVSARFKKQ